MSLSRDMVRELRERLRETMALVYVAGKPTEAAFFITEDLLLTCAHVPKVGPVEVEPFGRKRRLAEVVGRDDKADVMLLSSPTLDGDPSPCVVLARYKQDAPDGAVCLVGGYPRDGSGRLACEVVDNKAHWAGERNSLIIDPGHIVTWGMSGGPVVSTDSGAVIGIVQTSKDVRDALGGSAIPIDLAAKAFSEVKEALGNQTLAMVPWRRVLGRANWQRLRRPWHMSDRIDLRVTGDRTHWEVSIEHCGKVYPLKEPDLGKRVAEAIFHWAQRRHPRNVGEVELLGQLLARALFPADMPPWLKVLGWADDLLVCLHIAPGNDLRDIPWELAADPFPGKQDRFLAADKPFAFARIVDADCCSTAPPEPKPAADLRVLAVVAKPSGCEYKDMPRQTARPRRTARDADAMRGYLTTCISSGGLTTTPLVPPTPHGMDGALETAEPYDVLHYMGTGAIRNGRAEIVFMNHDGSALWKGVREVIETAGRTGVRLVVLELMQLPEDCEFQQLTRSDLGDVITGSVIAVVLTTHPVYLIQCEMFNRAFYESLGRGNTIEKAVQEARWTVWDSTSAVDAAGFGWFTVVTGSQTDICLAAPPPLRDPMKSGARGTEMPPTEAIGDVQDR